MTSDNDEGIDIKKESILFTIETITVFSIIILIPFILSGIWPPYVSVISESMEPNMSRGDMVYIVENERFASENSIEGIETKHLSENNKGDVIVYHPNGNTNRTPVIHRSITYVEEGDNWIKEVDKQYINAATCNEATNCPAPNDGFITLGDNNDRYDQTADLTRPVREKWIVGKAKIKIPHLGWVRLGLN